MPQQAPSHATSMGCHAASAPVSPHLATLVMQKAPQWEANAVVGNAITKMSLDRLLQGGKYAVLVFYPLDFTFVCPTELIAFNDRLKEFHEIKTEVAGISVDSEYTHLAWAQTPRNKGGLDPISLPLIADLSKSISRDYGVLHGNTVALRALVIIDPKGVIRHMTINELGIGRSVDETLRLLKAIQFHDVHGDVCPANWTPGSKSMKDDPEKAKAYFDTVGKK